MVTQTKILDFIIDYWKSNLRNMNFVSIYMICDKARKRGKLKKYVCHFFLNFITGYCYLDISTDASFRSGCA